MQRLTTPYEEKICEIPWNEYPRPQFKRDSFICLNGRWDFSVTTYDNIPNEFTEKILVPFPPESPLSGIERNIKDGEYIYYRRFFTVPSEFVKDRLILHFGAVDQICTVYLNGKSITKHEGGYIPFSLDITDFVNISSQNELIVAVKDELSKIYPYGKQTKSRGGMWYTPVSGIWQTVWLESLPVKPIRSFKITPTAVNVTLDIDTDAKEKTLTLKGTGESFTFTENTFTYTPRAPHSWTPSDPYLYEFTLSTDTDSVDGYFALREIGITEIDGTKRLTLNGEPYLFCGLLDQGYFPDGIFLPATKEGYEDDIRLAKELGFNMLRKHIKIEPLIFYHLCDKLGIVVFQDMVNNSNYSFIRDTALPTVGFKRLSDKKRHRNPRSREIFKQTMLDTIDLLYNVPSILCYTIFNEGWGQFLADEMYATAKGRDSTRLYDATSGWFWQNDSDFESEHIYFKRLRVKSKTQRPVFISEFGGYSHRVDGHLFSKKNYGYKSFASVTDYENAVISLYKNEVLPLVRTSVCALVYTQLSDVEDETNGFVTYDRQVVKVDKTKMRSLLNELYEAFKK